MKVDCSAPCAPAIAYIMLKYLYWFVAGTVLPRAAVLRTVTLVYHVVLLIGRKNEKVVAENQDVRYDSIIISNDCYY